MKISAVIPVYNRAEMVRRAIESVLNQTILPMEIIVVNDGSTDDTPTILNQYANRIQIINQENNGVSSARNTGIKAASGEWVAFLDSDDEWLPDRIENGLKFHEQNPQYRIFQSEEIWIRRGKRVNKKKIHQKYGGRIFKQCLPLCIVSPSAVLIETSLFNEMGYFDEKMTVCEDYDLWLRIAKKFEIGLNPVLGVIKYGGHPGQLSAKYWGMDHFRVRALEKQAGDSSLPPNYRQWVLEEILVKLEILINGYRKRKKDYTDLQKKYDFYSMELRLNRKFEDSDASEQLNQSF